VRPPIGGPNVCRSRSRTFCCPGWHQRGSTGLCLVPICSSNRCGPTGRCIKPGLCLCDGGTIATNCGNSNAIGSNGKGTFDFNFKYILVLSMNCNFFTHECIFLKAAMSNVWMEAHAETKLAVVVQDMLEIIAKNLFAKKSCENGGRCIGPNRCACVYGYTGRHCEIDYRYVKW